MVRVSFVLSLVALIMSGFVTFKSIAARSGSREHERGAARQMTSEPNCEQPLELYDLVPGLVRRLPDGGQAPLSEEEKRAVIYREYRDWQKQLNSYFEHCVEMPVR